MNIDPEIQFFLDELRAGWAKEPPFSGLTFPERRAVAEKVRARWNAGGPVMARTSERYFDPGAGELRVRVHRPSGLPEPAPALVYLHGGGFTLFSIDSHDRLMREYAQQGGFAVIGVDYPLSPEHKYPVALDRIEALMLWLKEHGAELGVDPTRMALGGDSAGANMSFGIVQRLHARGEVDLVRAILSNYGGYDASISDAAEAHFGGEESVMSRAEAEEYYGNYLNGDDEADDPHVYPILADLTGFPSVFLVIAECDILAEQGVAMDAHLRSQGVETRTETYPGAIHSFLEAMSVSEVARRAIADGAAFIRSKLD
ncbi:alpha/beta hydrolase [Brevundimonas sp.]|uniref:alpha/beta hydrolase n=1 Tax=Brevundimonas sp. TaxID=1871086 RepID=UPI003BA9ADC5